VKIRGQLCTQAWLCYDILSPNAKNAWWQRDSKRLLAKFEPQADLFELWSLGLLNESMEAVVLEEKYKNLFTETELAETHRRLEELGCFDQRKWSVSFEKRCNNNRKEHQ
jgi:hypothetical protein